MTPKGYQAENAAWMPFLTQPDKRLGTRSDGSFRLAGRDPLKIPLNVLRKAGHPNRSTRDLVRVPSNPNGLHGGNEEGDPMDRLNEIRGYRDIPDYWDGCAGILFRGANARPLTLPVLALSQGAQPAWKTDICGQKSLDGKPDRAREHGGWAMPVCRRLVRRNNASGRTSSRAATRFSNAVSLTTTPLSTQSASVTSLRHAMTSDFTLAMRSSTRSKCSSKSVCGVAMSPRISRSRARSVIFRFVGPFSLPLICPIDESPEHETDEAPKENSGAASQLGLVGTCSAAFHRNASPTRFRAFSAARPRPPFRPHR